MTLQNPQQTAATTPIIIVSRDRVDSLRAQVEWLEQTSVQQVHIVDMASSNPRLLAYLDKSPHNVVRLTENLGPHRFWDTDLRRTLAGDGFFVLTDPDVVPVEECPLDAVDRFLEALRRYPDYRKAGFGLAIDDIPEHYELADQVRAWESQFSRRRIMRGLFHAPIDTTFAVYRPDTPFGVQPSIRFGHPYVARHLPWYEDSNALSADEAYYRAHANSLTTWSADQVAEGHEAPPPDALLARMKWRAHVLLKLRRERSSSSSL